jgi:hypothetical protein
MINKCIAFCSLAFLWSLSPAQSFFKWEGDSISVGNRAENHVFYNIRTGEQKTVSAGNWHMAFSVQPSEFPNNTLQGTTIRVNNGKRVRVFEAPTSWTVSNFDQLDTTGMMSTWTELTDSDSTWDLGAFNTGLNLSLPPHLGGPDYGWALYNSITKNVESKGRIYVLFQDVVTGFGQGQTTTRVFAKKLYLEALVWDTSFVFVHDHIDNSDRQTVNIHKKAYPNRNFVYYNLIDNQIHNNEPPRDEWDLIFTDYYTLAESPGFGPPQLMTVTGTLSNKHLEILRLDGVNRDSFDIEPVFSTPFSKDIRAIGYDWKTHVGQGRYEYNDSLVFALKRTGDEAHMTMMRFNSFGGVSSGSMQFDKFTFVINHGSAPRIEKPMCHIYPNPGSHNMHLSITQDAIVEIWDMNGRKLTQWNVVSGVNTLDVSYLNRGMYIIKMMTPHHTVSQKYIKS